MIHVVIPSFPHDQASPENKDQPPEKANPDDKGAKEVFGPKISGSGYKDIVLDEKGNEKVNMNSLDEDNDEATDKKESPSEEDKADTKEVKKKKNKACCFPIGVMVQPENFMFQLNCIYTSYIKILKRLLLILGCKEG